MRKAKVAHVAFLAVAAALSHLSRGLAGAISESDSPLAILPLRDTVRSAVFADPSRIGSAALPIPPNSDFVVGPGGVRAFAPASSGRLEIGLKLAQVGEVEVPSASGKKGSRLAPSQSHGAVTEALNHFSLTPIQRLSIRDYVGEKKAEIQELTVNGKEVLILRDRVTRQYIGEATIHTRDDGSVVVTKLTGATFDLKHSVELPVREREVEEAEKVLKGSESLHSFNGKQYGIAKEKETPGKTISVPALSIEGTAQYGPVSESTAVFDPDGSGYERGMRTNLASASAGVEAGVEGKAEGSGFAGVSAGAGAQAFKVEFFANHFSKPEADEKGDFTRSVLGASGEAHATLAEIAGKAGCSEENGCGVGASLGFLGIGTGIALNYGAKVKIERSSAEGIPEQGIASTSEQLSQADNVQPAPISAPADVEAPSPSGQDNQIDTDDNGDSINDKEEADYEATVTDGSAEALNSFLSKYPDSVYANDVHQLEQAAENPGTPVPGDETKIY